MLDVVLDNNLSIGLVWDTFGHDYEEIARAGFDLNKALASGFWPKSRNFSARRRFDGAIVLASGSET